MEEFEEDQRDPEGFVQEVTSSRNIAADMEDGALQEIAQSVLADHDMDKASMSDWFERMERGIKLAKLVKEDRNYPFDGASNVKYPLITSAALQFNARAYPAIVPPDRIVKAKVWGKDEGGQKAARGERVSEHMSWQLAAQVKEWEEETDKLLVLLPIVGTIVRKWWYDPGEKRPRCRLVDPGAFIVNDKVKNLDDAPRCGEELPLYPTEIESRIRSGDFVEFEHEPETEDDQGAQDFVEQHTRLDLDEDGYDEPYVVTVHVQSRRVVRIVADFRAEDVTYQTETRQVAFEAMMQDPATGLAYPEQQLQPEEIKTGILSIRRGSYFAPFKFLPGMDGGFHGTGLGLLLGDISDSIDTIINMLLDAGHYASLGGGFIGSEFRMKGGNNRFRPGEWKTVSSLGADIKNAMVPVTFPGPDATLFQMLGMLIDAGREIASVKDVVTGEAPRHQQTATTTLALIEQGMMVFTAAYKRIFRALKAEYSLLAGINAETVDAETYQRFHDEPVDPRQDYDLSDMDIQPVADPRSVTKMQQAAKADMVMQLAQAGLVDQAEALSRIAEAMDIEDVESLTPKPDPIQQQMQAMGLEAARADLAEKMAKIELTMAQVEETRSAAIENMASAQSSMARSANEAKKIRLDTLMKILESDRARLESLLRGPGAMARQPGDGSAQGGGGQGVGAGQGIPFAGLSGGATGPGGLPGGSDAGGPMGGGVL